MEGVMAADLARLKIQEAQKHLENVSGFESSGVHGAHKLRKRIQAEVNFLQKGLNNKKELQGKDVQCSNLVQLGALADVAVTLPHVAGILQTFRNLGNEKIIVDIVADNGRQWIKVIMRNPKALHLVFAMGRRGAARPLNEVAEEFVSCAKLHPVLYAVPKVIFWFSNGVSEGLARSIEDRGALVRGTRIPDHDLGLPDFSMHEDSDSETDEESSEVSCYSDISGDISEEEVGLTHDNKHIDNFSVVGGKQEKAKTSSNLNGTEEVSPSQNTESSDERILSISGLTLHENCPSEERLASVNLDVTAMIAYVSSTSNGGADFVFRDKILNEQAACERKNPVKTTLDGYFEGRNMLACREAVNHFEDIVSVIGGAAEKARTEQLLARLTIVPGQDYFKHKLKAGGKIRALPRLTFGTGQALRAITVTSNMGFVRAAQSQGVRLAVLFHRPRALTEAKEVLATPLTPV